MWGLAFDWSPLSLQNPPVPNLYQPGPIREPKLAFVIAAERRQIEHADMEINGWTFD